GKFRGSSCTLALSSIRDTLIEGFSHFVTSMTAPVASGWSVCRVGLAPTGKRRLVTVHTQCGHLNVPMSYASDRTQVRRSSDRERQSGRAYASFTFQKIGAPNLRTSR